MVSAPRTGFEQGFHAFLDTRPVARDTIDAALHRAFREGNERGRYLQKRDVHAAREDQREPKNVALLLRSFAGRYDERGQLTEGNVLRDAADLLEQV